MATKPIETVTGKVVRLVRLRNTHYGNPRFDVHLDNAKRYRLEANASLGYEIENPEFRREPHAFALNGRGQISYVIR